MSNVLKLDEIVGQPTAVKILKSALPPGKPASGYLFVGPEGVGKRTAAYAWARALLCEKDGKDACGECVSCKKVDAGNHPDLIYKKPERREKKKKEEIDIDNIREISRELGFKPYESDRKILILDRAEKMNIAASNAFLKTLEEPPGQAVIIILTVSPRSLPPTIISRCQKVRFTPVPFEQAAAYLEERLKISHREAEELAVLSRGALGRAMEDGLEEDREIRSIAADIILRAGEVDLGEAYKLAAYFDKTPENKEKADRMLEIAVTLLRDLLAMKIQGKYDKLINVDLAPGIEGAARKLSSRKLLRAYGKTQELVSARRWNVNPFLIVSLLALELKE